MGRFRTKYPDSDVTVFFHRDAPSPCAAGV
jgi:hypothetical protein